MTEMIHPFISRLLSLVEKQERGALADLRRGLGQPPGTTTSMYRHIIPYLPEKTSRAQEAAYYLVAALFGLHPKNTPTGNIGNHLAITRTEGGDEALERRFTTLLAAHSDDLPEYLRQTVSFLKSKDSPVNWQQLFWDLQKWDDEDRKIQKQWANAFWGHSSIHSQPDQQL